jgi:peptidoglycan lytic transglycosylase
VKRATICVVLAFTLYLIGCSAATRFTNSGRESGPSAGNVPRGTPTASSSGRALLTVEGIASYYSYGFDKKKTSSGEIFNKDALTAAHREFPFGTVLRVTNLSNGEDVVVTVNDRGPVDKSRIIDLSEGAAREIGMIQDGTTKVRIEVLKWGQSPK